MRSRRHEPEPEPDQGQITLLMAVVVAAALMAGLALVEVATAALDRARARTAADAVVLATAVDRAAGEDLTRWYGARGVAVRLDPDHVWAGVGHSQAAAWAATDVGVDVAPAVVAIVARAEQLLGSTLHPIRLAETSVWLSGDDAALFATLSPAMLMCESDGRSTAGVVRFDLC